MITAARLRACRGVDGALAIFRELGYPIAPVLVDPEECRRAGVEIGWNGEATLQLAARLRRFDLFVLQGPPVAEESVLRFLRTYREYNLLTKSVLIYAEREKVSIYDLSSRRTLRRLDVDFEHPSAHAIDRLNLLAAGEPLALPRIYDRALDREGVTRRFFERFRDAVADVAASLGGAATESEDAARGQALLILSRLLFLSFVQEKGWLNGERRFLIDRLDAAERDGREFFAGVLQPLFFGVLNTPVDLRDDAARALGNIPYLNGGLFEPSPFERRHAVRLPNALMRRVLEEVFEKFAFSVDESDAAGTHVDPEMLGKVFESLMAEEERAASGSFYTPKEIVDVLTERAIESSLGDAPTIERLLSITVLDPACGSGAFLLSALGAIERMARKLSPELPRDLRQRIVERCLYGVDIKLEAVRLCELRLWLAIVSGSDADLTSVRPLPNLDRNILQGNSLLSPTDFLGDGRADVYRDWMLALRAQSDLIDRYRHAPSEERPALARLLRANDRRLASELLAKAIDADESVLQMLAAPQKDLFGRARAIDLERCHELQERITANRRELERVEEGELSFFSFDVHFAPVMAAGGFDVVAGNPPWVRNARIEARAKRMYADRYALFRAGGDRAAFHQPDLAVVFVERALALAKRGGVVSMLVPAKLLNAAYAAPLRRAAESLRVIAIDDWCDDARRYFDADTFPLGITIANGHPERSSGPGRGIGTTSCPGMTRRMTRITRQNESFLVDQRDLAVDSEWALLPADVGAILRRLRRAHRPLADVLRRKPLMGVKTGDNGSFFLDAERIAGGKLITADGLRIPMSAVCRCVRGRDVRRWSASDSQWVLWPPIQGWPDPPAWLERLAQARNVEPSSFKLAYVRPEHVGIKVAWKDVSRGMCAAVLPESAHVDGHTVPLIPNQTLYSLDAASLDEAYALAALLNSTIVDALLLSLAERAKDAHYRYFGRTVARMPLPALAECEQLVRLSRRAHQGASVMPELDPLVAAIYGVTDGELELLRRFVHARLAR